MNQYILIAIVLCMLNSLFNSISQLFITDKTAQNISGVSGSILSSIICILCIIGITTST
jgi:VanZ family protein